MAAFRVGVSRIGGLDRIGGSSNTTADSTVLPGVVSLLGRVPFPTISADGTMVIVVTGSFSVSIENVVNSSFNISISDPNYEHTATLQLGDS